MRVFWHRHGHAISSSRRTGAGAPRRGERGRAAESLRRTDVGALHSSHDTSTCLRTARNHSHRCRHVLAALPDVPTSRASQPPIALASERARDAITTNQDPREARGRRRGDSSGMLDYLVRSGFLFFMPWLNARAPMWLCTAPSGRIGRDCSCDRLARGWACRTGGSRPVASSAYAYVPRSTHRGVGTRAQRAQELATDRCTVRAA